MYKNIKKYPPRQFCFAYSTLSWCIHRWDSGSCLGQRSLRLYSCAIPLNFKGMAQESQETGSSLSGVRGSPQLLPSDLIQPRHSLPSAVPWRGYTPPDLLLGTQPEGQWRWKPRKRKGNQLRQSVEEMVMASHTMTAGQWAQWQYCGWDHLRSPGWKQGRWH